MPRPRTQRVAPDGKGLVEQWITEGGLAIYSQSTAIAAQRLLHDERAAVHWQQSSLGLAVFEDAVHLFDLIARDDRVAWKSKTLRERRDWKRRFDSAVETLLNLMPQGPTPPQVDGFPCRDYVLMEALRRVGQLPNFSDDRDAFRAKMSEVNEATRDIQWTIADEILAYQKRVESDVEDDVLMIKKPRDAKAARARFIVNFRHYSRCSVPVVAVVAAVMFDDEAIDERLVRRLTSPRGGGFLKMAKKPP